MLVLMGVFSACGSNTNEVQEDQTSTSSETEADLEADGSGEKLLTIENDVMDNKDMQIWYKVDSEKVAEDAKSVNVVELFLIKNNQIAHLAVKNPEYLSDMTIAEYNEKYGSDIQEKLPLTLGEIAQLTETDKIYDEVSSRYTNRLFSMRYDENKPFEFSKIAYTQKTDGSGNNTQEIDLNYVNAEEKNKVIRLMSPMGQFPVYDNVFAGYWGSQYTDVDDPEEQYITLQTNPNTRFVLDEPNPDKFEIE